MTMEGQAESAAYRLPTGELYIPGKALQRALLGGAKNPEVEADIAIYEAVRQCLTVKEEHVGLGVYVYKIDSQAVV